MAVTSPSIDIDEEVFEVIKGHAEPFVDTPNSVLRRMLGIDHATSRPAPTGDKLNNPAGRAAPGTLLPESQYELPILRYLSERGGRAPSREVVDAVGMALAHKLTELDWQELQSGDVRWRNRAAFVRLRLVERGELVKNSPRGTWEISDKGRQRLQVR